MARRSAKLNALSKNFGDDRMPIPFESNSQAPAPKHVTLPGSLPPESEIVLEIQTIVMFTFCMATQYLNLYRTVWWLNQSYTKTIVNFHLIDMNVLTFNLILITRNLIHHLVGKFESFFPEPFRKTIVTFTSSALTCFTSWNLMKYTYFIYLNHGLTGVLYIIYPVIMMGILYLPDLMMRYESYEVIDRQTMFDLFRVLIKPSSFSEVQPVHQCSSLTCNIRQEVDGLRGTFNDRLKFIVCRSVNLSYYATFLPLCLVQPQLYYDISWTAQHVAICWVSCCLLLTSHLYSAHFYDVLHKSSLHLGRWQKLETRNTLVPCVTWSDKHIYTQGVVVRHCREYYKAEGVANCAEPGNQAHMRFYTVFSNPVGGFGTLLGILLLLYMCQISILVRTYEWYKLVSMSLMILVNCMTIFRLVRSYYVLREVYKVEARLQDPGHLHSQ